MIDTAHILLEIPPEAPTARYETALVQAEADLLWLRTPQVQQRPLSLKPRTAVDLVLFDRQGEYFFRTHVRRQVGLMTAFDRPREPYRVNQVPHSFRVPYEAPCHGSLLAEPQIQMSGHTLEVGTTAAVILVQDQPEQPAPLAHFTKGTLVWFQLALGDRDYRLLARISEAEKVPREEQFDLGAEAHAALLISDLRLTVIFLQVSDATRRDLRERLTTLHAQTRQAQRVAVPLLDTDHILLEVLTEDPPAPYETALVQADPEQLWLGTPSLASGPLPLKPGTPLRVVLFDGHHEYVFDSQVRRQVSRARALTSVQRPAQPQQVRDLDHSARGPYVHPCWAAPLNRPETRWCGETIELGASAALLRLRKHPDHPDPPDRFPVGTLLWFGVSLQDQDYQLLSRVIKADRLTRRERLMAPPDAWTLAHLPDLQLTLVYLGLSEATRKELLEKTAALQDNPPAPG